MPFNFNQSNPVAGIKKNSTPYREVNEGDQFRSGNATFRDTVALKLVDSRYRPRGLSRYDTVASENGVFVPLCLIGRYTFPAEKKDRVLG